MADTFQLSDGPFSPGWLKFDPRSKFQTRIQRLFYISGRSSFTRHPGLSNPTNSFTFVFSFLCSEFLCGCVRRIPCLISHWNFWELGRLQLQLSGLGFRLAMVPEIVFCMSSTQQSGGQRGSTALSLCPEAFLGAAAGHQGR